jgi:hypothetical protein
VKTKKVDIENQVIKMRSPLRVKISKLLFNKVFRQLRVGAYWDGLASKDHQVRTLSIIHLFAVFT